MAYNVRATLPTFQNLGRMLSGLKKHLLNELRSSTYVYSGSGITWPSSTASLTLNASATLKAITAGAVTTSTPTSGSTLSVPIAFPRSGYARVEIEATCQPSANNSQVFVAMRKGGSDFNSTEILTVGEAKGRRSVALYLSDVPYTTATYTVSGVFFGGGGGQFSGGGGETFVITVTPL